MELLNKEVTRLENSSCIDKCINELDSLEHMLLLTKSAVATDQGDPHLVKTHIENGLQKAQETTKRINEHEKELYNQIHKFGKAIDKTFRLDVSAGYDPKLFPLVVNGPGGSGGRQLLNEAVKMHFWRTGEFDVAETFAAETGTSNSALREEFGYLHLIVSDILEKHSLKSAIDWCEAHHDDLLRRGSNLEYTLHRVEFIRLQDNPNAALAYAVAHLSRFGDTQLSDMQKLSTSLLYRGHPHSPYRKLQLLQQPPFEHLADLFSAEFCSLLDLPPQPPLLLASMAGTVALPVLTKMNSIIKSNRTEWSSKNELPVEIELPRALHFHEIFVCPVGKEQTTLDNPPMMLPCGHVLASSSVRLLGKDSAHHIFKCPYCPREANMVNVTSVKF